MDVLPPEKAPVPVIIPAPPEPPPKPVHEFNPLEGWRSFAAGLVAVAIGCYDVWKLGPAEGLTVEVDEILILVGIGLIAAMPNVFLKTLLSRGGDKGENGKNKDGKKTDEEQASK